MSTYYYKALDFILIFLTCSLAYWIRFDSFVLPIYYFLPTTVLAITSMFTLSITNFYQTINSESSPRQAIAAFSGLVISTMITIACLYLTKTGEDYSRIWLIISMCLILSAILLVRLILKKIFHISSNPRNIILLGEGKTAQSIKSSIESLPKHEILIDKQFSCLDDDGVISESRLLSIADYIEERRKDHNVKNPITEIWITYDVFSQFSARILSSAFNDTSVSLVYIPELPDLGLNEDKHIQIIAGIPTINSNFSSLQKFNQLLKFFEDQSIAWLALIILSPLLALITIAIKLDSPGPAIYKQLRYGLGGKSFLIWKFRTMYMTNSEPEFKQAKKGDPRITRVGKFLRRTSFDELPQLINVINGTMSIVGPRPHPEMLNEQHRSLINQYMVRHTSKPGITGLAQIKGFRGETAELELMEKRVKYDLKYIRNWTIFLDLKILILTVWHVITTDKAH